MAPVKLRYEGKFDWFPEGRIWTLQSHFVDRTGADRFKTTMTLDGLIELGIVKEKHG